MTLLMNSLRAGRRAVLAAAVSVSLFAGVAQTAVAEDAKAAGAADADKPIRALIVLGGCCHDYPHQKDVLTQGISARANVVWSVAFDPDKTTKHTNPVYESADWAKGFDVIVHDECTSDVNDPATVDRILSPHKDGLPAVTLHCGMHSYRTPGWKEGKSTPWFQLTGLQSTGHGPQVPIAITFLDKSNPITCTLSDWTTIQEELYNNAIDKLEDTATPLARGKQVYTDKKTGQEVTKDYVVAWTNCYNGKTRIFSTTLGHNTATCADPRYLDLVTRGLLWSVNKLDDAHLKPAKQVLIDQSK